MPRKYIKWGSATQNALVKQGSKLARRYRYGRKARIGRTPKNKQTHFHVRRISALREGDFSINTATGTGEYFRGLSFGLSDLEGYTELTALYDRYRITKVVLDFQWTLTNTVAGAVGPNASYAPQINLFRDYDDDITPTAIMFRESGRVIRKRLTANNNFRIAITPAVSVPRYKTGATWGYGPQWKQNIDMANPHVPHYGAKLQLICPQIDVGFVQVTAKYYVSCYQTR